MILQRCAIALAALLLSTFSGPAAACGTIGDWIGKYEDAGSSDDGRRAALVELSVACSDYAGKADDRRLLPILADALDRGLDYDLVQLVYDSYLCLPGARGETGYAALYRAMDRRACLDDAGLANWLESTADGALLRSGPGQSHAAIGWLRRGAMAERLCEDGAWIEVLTWTGQRGWVHGSLLAPYLTVE